VLIYAHDPRDPQKQAGAVALIESLCDGVLLWQVACEYLAASRKLEPLGDSLQDAWQDLDDLRAVWTTVLPNWSVLDQSHELMTRFSLSFWDALILAACLDSRVVRLYPLLWTNGTACNTLHPPADQVLSKEQRHKGM
jgi:predicted nucleic acid-binding protein